MADFEFRVDGLSAFNDLLIELGTNGARRAGRKAQRQGANVILLATRAAAPVQAISPRMNRQHKPGTLKKGFTVTDHGVNGDLVWFSVDLKKSAFYGKFLEYGTSRAAAKPFIRTSAENNAQESVSVMAQVLGPAIVAEAMKLANR